MITFLIKEISFMTTLNKYIMHCKKDKLKHINEISLHNLSYLTVEANIMLSAAFEKEELQVAFHMHPYKSPGPDGLNSAFYRRIWSL